MESKSEICETTALGNTRILKPKINQLLHWCFTWNNYNKEDIETCETLFKHLCHKYAFQEEIGKECGTPHLQGVISLKKRGRWSEFGLNKCIHWEKCIDVTASYIYCTKEDTRITGCKPYVFNYDLPYVKTIDVFYEWEIKIKDILDKPANDRFIYWFWEEIGCAGKTTFQKYIFTHYPHCVVLSGKGADMKNGVVEYIKKKGCVPKIVLLNIPRSVDGDFISFTGIEEVKDMFFFSGKYEGGMVCGDNPTVICFANESPNMKKMSKDRWQINYIG